MLRVIFGREFKNLSVTAQKVIYGADYDELKNVVIIMIVPYDPFGLDRMEYTIKNHCVEVPDMPYEDGAETLFLYTKGTKGKPGHTGSRPAQAINTAKKYWYFKENYAIIAK